MSGFLTNTGDIIIDAVLTDLGRQRLARGDGSFRVVKFALSDDEINYGDYDSSASGGSAYFDQQILLTPVLEAMTDNGAAQKSKLISIPRNNLLYLPEMVLNTITNPACSSYGLSDVFLVAVDEDTEQEYGLSGSPVTVIDGVLFAEDTAKGSIIRVDQGLNTTELSPKFSLDSDLVETQYMVQIDNRFGEIVNPVSGQVASVSYIDDDYVASYYLTTGDSEFVALNPNKEVSSSEIISGPRGTILKFKVKSSINLNSSDYLFSQLGGTVSMTGASGGALSVNYIDSTIRVVGGTTGMSVDIPIRLIKLA